MKNKGRLFVDKGEPSGTVVLNWNGAPEREFTHFAEAFHAVAKDAVANLRENPRFGLHGIPIEDFKAYPVVFLYRHALELYLKAVILVGAPMLAMKGHNKIDRLKLLSTHNLDALRERLEQLFEAYDWEWDFGSSHFKTADAFRQIIAEFQAIDAGSYAFRYPLDRKGNAALQANLRFDLFEFCSLLDELFRLLDAVAMSAYEELRMTLEALDEAEQLRLDNAQYEYEDNPADDDRYDE